MKQEINPLTIASTNNSAVNLTLKGEYGRQAITFAIIDENNNSCTIKVTSTDDLERIVEYIGNRLNATDEVTSLRPTYDVTGMGLCVFNYAGKLIDKRLDYESHHLTKGLNGYTYDELVSLFERENAIFVLFPLYKGSIGNDTIIKALQACIQLQIRFVTTGEPLLSKKMTLDDVASATGLDFTTVSRCTRSVVVYGPNGTFTMDNNSIDLEQPSLFDEGIKRYGSVVSRLEVLQRIKEMIDNEDKRDPLGDQEICDRLKAVGYEIERRTVAKYRGDLLGFPNSNDRREK